MHSQSFDQGVDETIAIRCSNYQQEIALAVNMKHHVNSLPADLSVREQFQLIGSVS